MHLCEESLELLRARRIRSLQLAAQPALAQSQQQLPTGALVERLAVGPRVELGTESDELPVLLSAFHEDAAKALVQLVIEVLGRQRFELTPQRLVCEAGGECVALEPLPGTEQPWRLVGPARRCAAGRC